MKNLLLLSFLALSLSAFSQDKIYKKGGEVIEATISEVGSSEIKYKVYKDTQGPIYTIEKDRVIKVIYQNGRTEVYQSSLKDPELYADQAKHGLKINFLSPLRGYTQLSYEKNLRPGRGLELTLGIIGLGKRQELSDFSFSATPTSSIVYREQGGAFVGGGYKFSKMPDYISGKDRYSHVMQGSYIKPEFLFGVYGQNFRTSRSSTSGRSVRGVDKKTVVFSSLLLNLGKQWVLGDKLLVDFYGGLGYVVDNLKKQTYQANEVYYEEDFAGDHFAVISTGRDSGFGIGAGFKVGILLK